MRGHGERRETTKGSFSEGQRKGTMGATVIRKGDSRPTGENGNMS